MSASELPLLALEGLGVRRGGDTLLADVSLVVAPGTIHALVGPNGAGKSTLLRCVLGLSEFEGRIRCHWRGDGRIGYVPQALAIDRTLPITVGEFLALARQRRPVCLGLARSTRARIAMLLEEVGLGGLERRALGALSGGERQRVLLANALDPSPELLLLDEPTSGLDEPATARFEERLLALRAAGRTTVLLVSHDLDQVRRVADRVTVLQRSVRATGTPAEALAG
jgi:zinc transport system ATP-binding protein